MTCRQLEPDLVDLARGVAVDRGRAEAAANHLRDCAICAVFVERQRAMSVALTRLASAERVPPPAARELTDLLAAFDRPPSRSRRLTVGVGLSLAASVLIVAALSIEWNSHVVGPALPHAAPPAADAPFVLLPGATALPRFEHGEVIRVEVPSPEGAFQADVLVGQDGLPRAVRLVN